MTQVLHELFFGAEIWLPALLGFYVALMSHVLIRWTAGPTREGQIIYRDGTAEIIIWCLFLLCFFWSLGRQVYVWFQAVF